MKFRFRRSGFIRNTYRPEFSLISGPSHAAPRHVELIVAGRRIYRTQIVQEFLDTKPIIFEGLEGLKNKGNHSQKAASSRGWTLFLRSRDKSSMRKFRWCERRWSQSRTTLIVSLLKPAGLSMPRSRKSKKPMWKSSALPLSSLDARPPGRCHFGEQCCRNEVSGTSDARGLTVSSMNEPSRGLACERNPRSTHSELLCELAIRLSVVATWHSCPQVAIVVS
jgi:hypothetical protein